MAVVDRAERDVVVELGVPLEKRLACCPKPDEVPREGSYESRDAYGPTSDGVPGLEDGGGRLIKVGADIVAQRGEMRTAREVQAMA
jgi:hypothetical protein